MDVRKSFSIAFLTISDQYTIFIFVNFFINGLRRPTWMSQNHFRSHFWPFQIDTELFLLIFLTKWPPSVNFGWDDNIELVRYIYLAPGGGCEVLSSPCLSVCVSVCPANILVFYLSAIRRDIDLKFIQDTYSVVINSQRKKLNMFHIFCRHLVVCPMK